MNQAHFHLIVNHFPIILPMVGFVILLVSFFLNQNVAKRIAYFVFISAAVFSAISMSTGEGAEHVLKQLPNFSKHYVHEHEEWAEKFALLNYFIAALSLASFYLSWKMKSNPKLLITAILVLSLGTIILGAKTGTSGGEISHTEIRNESNATINVDSLNTPVGKENHDD